MDQHLTLEQEREKNRAERGCEPGYPVSVWHATYAPVHPAACDTSTELRVLLAQGWTTSREALTAPEPMPAAAVVADDDVAAMIANETRSERQTRPNKRKQK